MSAIDLVASTVNINPRDENNIVEHNDNKFSSFEVESEVSPDKVNQ